mmetsp:Transcript_33504/g.71815  ORF Transcript_33504/g.71815 Transcript_33504/m.71815 type:complete len:313 (+) Transcript_33504:2352-3290(+)
MSMVRPSSVSIWFSNKLQKVPAGSVIWTVAFTLPKLGELIGKVWRTVFDGKLAKETTLWTHCGNWVARVLFTSAAKVIQSSTIESVGGFSGHSVMFGKVFSRAGTTSVSKAVMISAATLEFIKPIFSPMATKLCTTASSSMSRSPVRMQPSPSADVFVHERSSSNPSGPNAVLFCNSHVEPSMNSKRGWSFFDLTNTAFSKRVSGKYFSFISAAWYEAVPETGGTTVCSSFMKPRIASNPPAIPTIQNIATKARPHGLNTKPSAFGMPRSTLGSFSSCSCSCCCCCCCGCSPGMTPNEAMLKNALNLSEATS